jgi:DNA-binding NtrC family response regulator
MSTERVLVIEHENSLRAEMTDFLQLNGFNVMSGQSCDKTEELALAFRPDVVVMDCDESDKNVIDLMLRLRKTNPSIAIIMLAEHGSIDFAVQAVKEGADQFLTKPVDLSALPVLVQRLADAHHIRQNQIAEHALRERNQMSPFLGTSATIRRLSELAHNVAAMDNSILIGGETGTGKGLLARWIHDHSPRSAEVFAELKCSGFRGDSLESELFGERASDSTTRTRVGLMEIAHKGTLFLDEICELDVQMQPRLLKILEEKQFRSAGDIHDRNVDFRLISATHHDVAKLVQEKIFRSDLYFPISTISLIVPSLRDRVEDIEPLARHFAEQLAKDLGVPRPELSQSAISALQAYSWPGNIRELRNLLEHAILVSGKHVLTERDLLFDSSSELMSNGGFGRTLQQVQRQYIEEILFREGWRVEAAAKKLGMPRSSLYQKIKEFNIPRPGASHHSHGADRRLQN